MADRERIDDETLKALVNHEIMSAVKYDDDKGERNRAVEYYEGKMTDTPSRPNGSKLMSRDVADTIGWMLPGIIRVFTGSDRMAEYEPVGKGDDKFAKEATDYCNHIFFKDNEGYRILWNATHDALLQKNAIIKHWWDDTEVCTYSEHSGMTAEDIAILEQDGGVVIGQSPGEPQPVMTQDETGQMVPTEVPTFNIKLKRVNRKGTVRVECIDPRRFIKDAQSITLEKSRFVAHWEYKTRSELIEMKFDRDMVDGLPAFAAAFANEDRNDTQSRGYSGHNSTAPIKLHECFYQVDMDGDGVAESIRAYIAGDGGSGELLYWEACDDDVFFSDIPCEPVPHQFEARSVADETMDMQQVNTVLTRGLAENLYWTNNPMLEAEEGSVLNPEMLANPVFGGTIWRKKNTMATSPIKPLVIPFVGDKILMGLEHFSQQIEKRTGVSRSTMALDPETLQNQSATANQNQKDASYSQVELIARNMAELGWKRVFKMILRLVVKHQDRPRIIRLKDEPVEMDPRFWNSDMDVEINVGLGTGSRDRDMAMLNNILMTQINMAMQLAQAGFHDKAIAMIPKIIKTATKLAESSGIRNPDEYYPAITEDDVMAMIKQAAKPKPDPALELERQKIMLQMQLEQEKAQAAVQKEAAQMQADLQVKLAELQKNSETETQKQQFEFAKLEEDARQKALDREHQMQIEMMKLQASAASQQNQLQSDMTMHGEKLAHDTKSKARDGKAKQNEMLIKAGKTPPPDGPDTQALVDGISQAIGSALAKAHSAPKRIVRDQSGRAVGIESAQQ